MTLLEKLQQIWPNPGERLGLVWTQNRTVLLSCRLRDGVRVIRLHTLFAAAEAAELQAIVDFLCKRTRAAACVLRQFVQAQRPLQALPPPAARVRRTAPSAASAGPHALQQIFDALNAAYFHGGCTAQIGWGRAGHTARRRRRGMQLGCYVEADNTIRIHPALNQAFVPDYVVAGVVFHEMLHEIFGCPVVGGRRQIHPPEFVAVEQSHPDFRRAQAWEKAHVHRLLSFRA